MVVVMVLVLLVGVQGTWYTRSSTRYLVVVLTKVSCFSLPQLPIPLYFTTANLELSIIVHNKVLWVLV